MNATLDVIIPTLNEEKNIKKCLESIFRCSKGDVDISIIIVDNYSEDKTIKIASEYNVQILYNSIRDPEVSKLIGFLSGTSEFFMYLDADITIQGEDYFKKLLQPLQIDESIAGSFSRFIPDPNAPAVARYLRYHPLELDPILAWFCPSIDDVTIENHPAYHVVDMSKQRVPPVGICMYRRNILNKAITSSQKFMDIDVPIAVAKMGFARFAYVPSAHIYHSNIRTIQDLKNRRIRNLHKVFIPNHEKRRFVYFDATSPIDILKILLLVFNANTFVYFSLVGIKKAINNRDWACLLEPIIAWLLANSIIFEYLKTPSGLRALRVIVVTISGRILAPFRNVIETLKRSP